MRRRRRHAPQRPGVNGNRRIVTTIRFKKPLLARLQEVADRQNITRSHLIESVLIDHVNASRQGPDPLLDINGDVVHVEPEADLFA